MNINFYLIDSKKPANILFHFFCEAERKGIAICRDYTDYDNSKIKPRISQSQMKSSPVYTSIEQVMKGWKMSGSYSLSLVLRGCGTLT